MPPAGASPRVHPSRQSFQTRRTRLHKCQHGSLRKFSGSGGTGVPQVARLVDLSHPMVDGMPVYPGIVRQARADKQCSGRRVCFL